MACAADLAEAKALWCDPGTPVQRRCLAARAIGLLGDHGPEWRVDGVADDDSALGRVRSHATRDADRRRMAESRARDREEAAQKTVQLGATSLSDVIALLQNRSESSERRVEAAAILRGLRRREAVGPLIEALAEGQQELSWMCMSALTLIGSRRGARRLMRIAGGDYPLAAKQEAVYALWWLEELRAESLFIRLSSALDTEEEYTRDMATEALGNTNSRPRTQRAIAKRLFDPSVSIRYSALCAAGSVDSKTTSCLREALVAKLADPARVDDNRVIAAFAAELLGIAPFCITP
jgi:HEAT repeat protein